jgi:hypothetical protein
MQESIAQRTRKAVASVNPILVQLRRNVSRNARFAGVHVVVAFQTQSRREQEHVPHPRALEAIAILHPLCVGPEIDVVQDLRADGTLSRRRPSAEESCEDGDLEIALVNIRLEYAAWVERRHAAGLVWYCVVETAVEEIVHAIL